MSIGLLLVIPQVADAHQHVQAVSRVGQAQVSCLGRQIGQLWSTRTIPPSTGDIDIPSQHLNGLAPVQMAVRPQLLTTEETVVKFGVIMLAFVAEIQP